MRFTIVILSACFCLNAVAEDADFKKMSDEDMVAAAEQLTSDKASEKTPDNKLVDEKAAAATSVSGLESSVATAKSEAETPVFTKKELTPKTDHSLIWRLGASLAFIAVIGSLLIYASRKWARAKSKGGEKARIEVIHNFHMTPKRSLSLIRVAGEVMLIGCTDQSVNFLKSVSLIDDELEGILGKDFNNFLEDDFSISDVRGASNGRSLRA
jgi:flagellar biogenesis protein FliO